MVLHHTKTPNGGGDSNSRLRAVYRFHAIELGWGDLGYHFVVDEAGVVYEGRSGSAELLDGGPVVIGGHVYGQNRGNVGIALLGTLFEQPPSPRAWTSLVQVMGWIAHQHGLDPLGGQRPADVASATLRAHCDLRDTTCPGEACYALLPALRAEVTAAVRGLAGRTGMADR